MNAQTRRVRWSHPLRRGLPLAAALIGIALIPASSVPRPLSLLRVDQSGTCRLGLWLGGYLMERAGQGVVERSAALFRTGGPEAKSADRGLDPLDPVQCWSQRSTAGGARVFISTPRGPCGWLDPANLLDRRPYRPDEPRCAPPEPLRLADHPRFADTQGAFPLRVVLLNAGVHRAEVPLDAPLGVAVPVFNEPAGTRRGSLPLFGVYPVFARRLIGTDDYLLIGRSGREPAGWVRGRDLAIWPGGLAVRPRAGGGETPIQAVPGDASGPQPGKPGRTLARARDPGKAAGAAQALAPAAFPVLSVPSGTGTAPALEFAAVATRCAPERPCTGPGGLSWDQRRGATGAAADLAPVDLLLLVEATAGMAPTLNTAAAAATGTLTGPDDRGWRIGAAVYGDYLGRTSGPRAPIQYREAVALGPPKGGAPFAALARQAPWRDRRRDPGAALFTALRRAAVGTPWRALVQRYLVHLGARADRLAQPPDAVLTALSERRLTYLPVAIRGPGEQRANARLLTQTAAVLTGYSAPATLTFRRSSPLSAVGDGTDPNTQPQDIGRELSDLLRALATAAREAPARLLADPEWQRLDQLGAVAARLVDAAAEPARALGAGELDPARPFIAFVGTAKTGADPAADWRTGPWEGLAALEDSTLPLVSAAMQVLCTAARAHDGASTLADRVALLFGGIDGQPLAPTAAPYDYLEQVLRIPLPRESLLRRPLREVALTLAETADPETSQTPAQGLCRAATLFELIGRGQRIDPAKDLTWNGHDWSYQNARPYRWTIHTGGLDLVYVPLDYFP